MQKISRSWILLKRLRPLDEIFEYFREAETESIDDALAELGEEYFTEEEIRLVRIKFFSELAN